MATKKLDPGLDPYTLRQVAAWHKEQREHHWKVGWDKRDNQHDRRFHDYQAFAHGRSWQRFSRMARRLESKPKKRPK